MPTPESEFLKGLPPDQTTTVLSLGSPRSLSEGTILFRLGDEADEAFLVMSGKVNLTLPMRLAGRKEEVQVEERNPGRLVGWSGLIPPHRFTLQAAASVDTELLVLPRAALFDLFSAQPEIGYRVFSNLARVIGQRFQLLQAMWIREMQRVIDIQSD